MIKNTRKVNYIELTTSILELKLLDTIKTKVIGSIFIKEARNNMLQKLCGIKLVEDDRLCTTATFQGCIFAYNKIGSNRSTIVPQVYYRTLSVVLRDTRYAVYINSKQNLKNYFFFNLCLTHKSNSVSIYSKQTSNPIQ